MSEGVGHSKCVFNYSYDEETQALTVEFQQRGTYRYSDVPIDVFNDFENSGSLGQYFNNNIRNTYSGERIG